MKLFVYADQGSACVLEHDSGVKVQGVPEVIREDGRQQFSFTLPDSIPNAHGAWITIDLAGHHQERQRGILYTANPTLPEGEAMFQADDFYPTPLDIPTEPGPVDPPDPGMPGDPMGIINHVYATTHPNLATHDGCGKFTEDCCKALHENHSAAWGHILKTPGQNQYNGHAVDAVMLLGAAPGAEPGVYDIIKDSVSSQATPVFNYVEPPNYELWFYPAATYRVGMTRHLKHTLRRVVLDQASDS